MMNKNTKCEIKNAKASNPVCSHVKFEWTNDSEDGACDDVTQYQIKVKTKSGSYRELSAIPGGY